MSRRFLDYWDLSVQVLVYGNKQCSITQNRDIWASLLRILFGTWILITRVTILVTFKDIFRQWVRDSGTIAFVEKPEDV